LFFWEKKNKLKKKGVDKNETKAFYYFLAGADMHSSSDALFNTGYCLQNGIKIFI